MSERRSVRARKQIDYAKLEEDNDDDFADPTPPPPKKQKKTEKTDKSKDNCSKPKPSLDTPARLPIDQRLYERDLQASLQLSIQESQSQPDSVAVSPDRERQNTAKSQAIFHSTPLPHTSGACEDKSFQESQSMIPSAIPPHHYSVPHLSVEVNDDIEFLGSIICSDTESPSVKKPSAARKRKTCVIADLDKDESSDEEFYVAEESSDSDEDFGDADSDFDRGMTQKKSKGKQAAPNKKTASNKKPTAAVRKAVTSAVKNTASEPARQSPLSCSSTAYKSTTSMKCPLTAASKSPPTTSSPSAGPHSLVTSHKPAWRPPSQSIGNSSRAGGSLTSPSSGLRIGLSRHARIKSLHPSLKVNT